MPRSSADDEFSSQLPLLCSDAELIELEALNGINLATFVSSLAESWASDQQLKLSPDVLCECNRIAMHGIYASAGMSMNNVIEQARPSDFLDIAALDRIAWADSGSQFIPDGEHVWRVWCEYATVLVARTDRELPITNHIAGALVMFPTERREQFLHKIMVHPDCRGRGLGTELMQAGLQRATVPVLLTVNPDNVAAVRVYEKSGYRVRERVDGYYRSHEHRYIMEHSGNGSK